MLCDIAAADYLGWGESGVAGYYGTAAGRDINHPGTAGLARRPEAKPKRFSMSYELLSLGSASAAAVAVMPEGTSQGDGGAPLAGGGAGRRGRRLRVQVWIDDGEPVPSVVTVWPTADWHEREAFDMMGIRIEGHPNLSRLLMDDDWEGHPLRKDYPIGGEPVRFSGEQ